MCIWRVFALLCYRKYMCSLSSSGMEVVSTRRVLHMCYLCVVPQCERSLMMLPNHLTTVAQVQWVGPATPKWLSWMSTTSSRGRGGPGSARLGQLYHSQCFTSRPRPLLTLGSCPPWLLWVTRAWTALQSIWGPIFLPTIVICPVTVIQRVTAAVSRQNAAVGSHLITAQE